MQMTCMRPVFAVLGTVVILGTNTRTAQAQASSSGSGASLGAFGGVSMPLGDYSGEVKTGWDGGAVIQFKPPASPVGFQVDGTYMENKLDPTGGKDRWFFGTGNIVFGFPVASSTRLRPYLIGGGGIYGVKRKFDDGTQSQSATKFGLNAGAGFDIDFQSNVSVFVEARFHNVFVEGSDRKFIPVNAGIRFTPK
jgi:opacity protein-like surface antigen